MSALILLPLLSKVVWVWCRTDKYFCFSRKCLSFLQCKQRQEKKKRYVRRKTTRKLITSNFVQELLSLIGFLLKAKTRCLQNIFLQNFGYLQTTSTNQNRKRPPFFEKMNGIVCRFFGPDSKNPYSILNSRGICTNFWYRRRTPKYHY